MGACGNVAHPPETQLTLKSRDIYLVHCRALYKISKRFGYDKHIMDERGLAKLEFEINFGQILCIATGLPGRRFGFVKYLIS